MHERKGACMYYYRSNSSKQPNKDPGPSAIYFERSKSYHMAPGPKNRPCSYFIEKHSCSLKDSSGVQKHLSQQGYLCSPGTGKIHNPYRFHWWYLLAIVKQTQNPTSSADTLYGSYVSEKHQLVPKWHSLRKGAAGWSWVGLCLWEKYSQKFIIKGICCSEICLLCLFYCSENCSEFVLKKDTGHQTRHTYRQYLSWFQMGVIFFRYKTSKTNNLEQMKRTDKTCSGRCES